MWLFTRGHPRTWLVGGWATLLKNISQLGWWNSQYDGKSKNVPNHHFRPFPISVLARGKERSTMYQRPDAAVNISRKKHEKPGFSHIDLPFKGCMECLLLVQFGRACICIQLGFDWFELWDLSIHQKWKIIGILAASSAVWQANQAILRKNGGFSLPCSVTPSITGKCCGFHLPYRLAGLNLRMVSWVKE